MARDLHFWRVRNQLAENVFGYNQLGLTPFMNFIRTQSPIPNGMWQIDSVLANFDLAQHDDFQTLETAATKIYINPIGVEFSVQRAQHQSAILRSGSDLYFADVDFRGNRLALHLTRPSCGDSVSIEATLIDLRQ